MFELAFFEAETSLNNSARGYVYTLVRFQQQGTVAGNAMNARSEVVGRLAVGNVRLIGKDKEWV